MGRHSGFDNLFSAIHSLHDGRIEEISVPPQSYKRTVLGHLFGRPRHMERPKPPSQPVSPFTEPRHELVAMEALSLALRHTDAVILLSVGESQFCGPLAHARADVKSRMALFLHQPPSWLEKHWRDWSLMDGLGVIICLGPEQRKFIQSKVSGPVYCIRHGVDSGFFTPPPARPRLAADPKLLFVGQWMRDFQTLHETYQILRNVVPRISIDCVVPRTALSDQHLSAMVHDGSVRWHYDLSDRQLRSLYREATVLFLPLSDAVANNALLEALATGLPIVTTDVGDVSFYLRDSGAHLCQSRNPHDHASAVKTLCHDRTADAGAVVLNPTPDLQHLEWNGIAKNVFSILGSFCGDASSSFDIAKTLSDSKNSRVHSQKMRRFGSQQIRARNSR